MSNWTYITGTVQVDVFARTQHESDYILKTVLDHLPVVFGSERDMDVHIVQRRGTDSSSSLDEFGEKTNNLINSNNSYEYKSRFSGWLETQSRYILVIDGVLRDVDSNSTYKDFIKWLTRLSKRISVADVLVNVYDSWYGNAHLINESDKWGGLYDYSDNNWTNYLRWRYPEDEGGDITSYNPHKSKLRN